MDFDAREDADGVRLLWNAVPKSRLQHQRNVIPLAALYTPLNNKNPALVEAPQHDMVRCRQCTSFLNPYVAVDGQVWHCQFCGFANRLVVSDLGQYSRGILPEATTIEYQLGENKGLPSVYVYVVDTCFGSEDVEAFAALKEAIVELLALLPSDALIAFISYGKNVSLHEVAPTAPGNRCHIFNGAKDYSKDQVQKALGLIPSTLRQGKGLSSVAARFLSPVDHAEYHVLLVLELLVTNTFPHLHMKERPLRATGTALGVAAHVLSSILEPFGTVGGHVLCFVAGATTHGPGNIVGQYLKEPLRSHHDIDKSNKLLNLPQGGANTKVDLLLVKKAKAYYAGIAKVLSKIGLSCNFFIGSYDQVGLYEMDEVCYKTAGCVVMSDSFATSIFKQSFYKFFLRQVIDLDTGDELEYLDMAYLGTLECRTTKDFAVQGLIGQAAGLPYKKENTPNPVSSISVGDGNTNSWMLCSVNPQSTYAIFLEKLDSPALGTGFVQFLFHYLHPDGRFRLRVTTVPITVVNDVDPAIEGGFDQCAALVVVARDSVNKLQRMNSSDDDKSTLDLALLQKHLDKLVIDFCHRFAHFKRGDVTSFTLSNTYALFPQFVFHLRRSPFIQVFNNSPDESLFVRHVFMHEDVNNTLIMVQPTLFSYDINTYAADDTEPELVLLDLMSLGPQKILLLDTFFHILIYHGSKVAQWRKADYHNQPGYEHFKSFLEAPRKEAMTILMDRFPLPRFIDCDEGGSQARFLMAKLNPSTTYATNPNHMYGSSFSTQLDVLTDDANLQLFMNHVRRIVVARK